MGRGGTEAETRAHTCARFIDRRVYYVLLVVCRLSFEIRKRDAVYRYR